MNSPLHLQVQGLLLHEKPFQKCQTLLWIFAPQQGRLDVFASRQHRWLRGQPGAGDLLASSIAPSRNAYRLLEGSNQSAPFRTASPNIRIGLMHTLEICRQIVVPNQSARALFENMAAFRNALEQPMTAGELRAWLRSVEYAALLQLGTLPETTAQLSECIAADSFAKLRTNFTQNSVEAALEGDWSQPVLLDAATMVYHYLLSQTCNLSLKSRKLALAETDDAAHS